MKTKFLPFILTCALIFSALPLAASSRVRAHSMSAMIITGTNVNGWAFGSAQTVTLRFFADQDFDTSTGEIIKAGNSRSGTGFYRSYTCSFASATVLTIPTITDIPTTTDSPTVPAATWTARFFQGNTPRDYWIAGFFIKHTVSNPTWAIIYAYNNPPGFQPHPNAITYDQAALLVSQSLGTLNFANVGTLGRIETTVTPTDPSHPKALIDEDPRVPSQAEHDALAGTNGTPSSSNKYVTNTDPRANEDYNASSYASLTAALAVVPATGGTVVVSTSMAAAGVSVPAYVQLRVTGKGQLTGSGTVTILGDFVAPRNKQVFGSGLTVSLSGNKVLTEVYPEWWGGGAGVAATTNTTACQAASDALVTIGAGVLTFGYGDWNFNSLWTIGSTTGGGDGLGSFTGIGLKGVNGLTGTTFNWSGTISGQMIKIYRGRYSHIEGIKFNNSVAKGSTIGLWFSGAPALGEQTSNALIQLCNFSGFHVGTQAGDGGGSAAGELTYQNSIFQSNDIGYLGASSGNSLVIRFNNCSGYGNAQAAIDLGAGSGDTHIAGGGFSSNGSDSDLTTGDIRLNLGWNGTVHIQDCRFELSNEVGAGGGILNASSFGSVKIVACRFVAPTIPAYACIRGAGNWAIDSCRFGGDAETGWIPYATGDNNGGGTYRIMNSAVQNTSLLDYNTGGNGDVGLRLWAEGNYSISSGIVTKLDDLIPGLIGQTPGGFPLLVGLQRVNTYGQVSTDVYLWTNQDITPSAKWAKLFKTQNSAGTTYTNFLDGVEGQTISVFVNDANTTFKNNTTIVTRTGSDVSATNGLTYSFTFSASKWRML